MGNRLQNIAQNAGSLWTTYALQEGALQGLDAGIGLFAVGERAGDPANSLRNAGFRADGRRPVLPKADVSPFFLTNLIAQLNVQNLFDAKYSSSAQAQTIVDPGAPLTVLGSLKLEFY